MVQSAWLQSQPLGRWLGTWEGTTERQGAEWLRFYNENGSLVPLPKAAARSEVEQVEQERDQARTQAEQQSLLAERLAERRRELGESDTL